MTKEQFLEKMIDLLDTEDDIVMDSILKDIEEWDSLSYVSFLAMANVSAGKKLVPEMVKMAQTIGDLFELVKG
jgi:acyl carrier protein